MRGGLRPITPYESHHAPFPTAFFGIYGTPKNYSASIQSVARSYRTEGGEGVGYYIVTSILTSCRRADIPQSSLVCWCALARPAPTGAGTKASATLGEDEKQAA